MIELDSLMGRVAGAVDRLADEPEALSHRLHAHPELADHEEQAHAWLTEFLEAQLRPDARTHGIIVEGGQQPNIIPEHASAEFYLRALARDDRVAPLRRSEGAARATGCGVTVTPDPVVHEPLRPNATLAAVFARNLAAAGMVEDPEDEESGYGSTEGGNVSQVLPTIHPSVRIAPDGVPAHSREFAEWARSPLARTGLLVGAKVLAPTALDLLASPETLAQAEDEFTRGGRTP